MTTPRARRWTHRGVLLPAFLAVAQSTGVSVGLSADADGSQRQIPDN